MEKEHFSQRFRPVELVVMGYPFDAHRILKKFPMSGIQIFLFIMCQIYKIKFQKLKSCLKDSLNVLEKKRKIYLCNI